MWLDLEEFFPPRTELIGLQLASDDDFERCKALLDTDSELYRELYTHWRIIVIRKSDIPRLAHLSLQYTEIEQIDPDSLPPDERYRRERELIDAWKPHMAEWLERRR